MFEELFYIHRKTVEDVPMEFKRYLHAGIDWDARHICITGCRGTGKTTLLLQYYTEIYNDVEKCLFSPSTAPCRLRLNAAAFGRPFL